MTDPIVSALDRLMQLSAPPTLDQFMRAALLKSAKVIVHPDTERMNWLEANTGISRRSIDEAMSRPAERNEEGAS